MVEELHANKPQYWIVYYPGELMKPKKLNTKNGYPDSKTSWNS